jgi:hypothetical protein
VSAEADASAVGVDTTSNIFVDRVVHHEMLIDLFTQQHAVDDAIGNSFTL